MRATPKDNVPHLQEKRQNENREYRPITLLENRLQTAYQMVANKPGKYVKKLIHEDQAGFVPGRSLFDHTRLAHLMVDYAEKEGQNGCIISLDQEKAYERLTTVLWDILKEYRFPAEFVNLIKAMYSKAKTSIMINGVIPAPIKVERGVRQGDLMSCLLYNLEIELLAAALRTSKKLKGIKVKDHPKLIAKFFADDTLVYLGANNKFGDLEDIVNLFCKHHSPLNMERTEVLPKGIAGIETKC